MEDLDKSGSAAEGMTEAEVSTSRRSNNEYCLNCGTKLLDSFCHHCGQKDIPRRQTLGELWMNFISSFWSYEGKFFTSTRYLILRPGFLAKEYNAGRRESYFHPARMYVFISFVFFLLFVSLPDKDKTIEKEDEPGTGQLTPEQKAQKVDSALAIAFGKDSTLRSIGKAVNDSIRKRKDNKTQDLNVNLAGVDYKTVREYDSAQQLKSAEERDGWFKRRMTIRGIELNQKYKDKPSQFKQDFLQAFEDNFSKILFFLLPVFALLLKLLYIRHDYYYSEHLVFSIYYYNFFYLGGSIELLAGLFSPDWVLTIIQFWIFFYLLFGLKRMYGQSWRKTVLKFGLLTFAFMICMGLGLGFAAMVFLMMI